MGAGLGKKLASVHWGVVGQMASPWVFTIPAAGLLGGAAWEISNAFGSHDNLGALVIAVLAALAAFMLFRLAQRNKVTAADLDRTNLTPEEEAELAGAPAATAVA